MLETAVVAAPELDGGNEIWVEALPARVFHTPQYGPVEITRDKLQRFVNNFNNRVRGQDVATDFDHGMDRAKGNQASGWYREFALKPAGDDPTNVSLFARIELTDDARQELQDKKWKYFSLEWEDEWLDNDGRLWNDVVVGGGFTNRPIAKNTMPINFSEEMWEELDYDTKKEFAVWSTASVNDLPDSCFLYVESGGKKDADGKTTPRSLRHLPYKNASGSIDLPHLRNAIARIPQMKGISDSLKSSLQARARRMLGSKSSSMSEDAQAAYDFLTAQGFEIALSESKEWEHSEPGRGFPPAPNLSPESGIDDIAITERWRRMTPPIAFDPNAPPPGTGDALPPPWTGGGQPPSSITGSQPPPSTGGEGKNQPPSNVKQMSEPEGGKTMSELTVEQEFELRTILGVNKDGDVVEAARLQLGELTELKRNVDAASQERKFAEDYPAFWNEHNKLMDRDRSNSARAFSESVSRVRKAEGFGLKETAKGLSMMSLQKITELHKHFSEGKATLDEFEDCIRTIVNGGIVEFGEIGTSANEDVPIVDTSTSAGIASARRLFAEVVSKVQSEHSDWDYSKCMDEAARKHPELAEAYAVALPA